MIAGTLAVMPLLSTVQAEEGESMRKFHQQATVQRDGAAMFVPAQQQYSKAETEEVPEDVQEEPAANLDISLNGDLEGIDEVETEWSADAEDWVTSYEFSWVIQGYEGSDPFIENAQLLFIETSDNGLTYYSLGTYSILNVNDVKSIPLTGDTGSLSDIYGLGCKEYQAIVVDEDLSPLSDYSNEIEVCTSDPTLTLTFPDVPDESAEMPYTFYEQIESLAEDNVVGGFEDGYFRPEYPVTRAQMSKFVRRAFFGTETDTSCGDFDDVDSDHAFYTEITTLKCNDVIGGYEDGTFKPDELVTRAESMKFAMNGLRVSKEDSSYLAYDGDEERFSDVPTDYTFYEVIMAASENGIVSGYEDDTFKPEDFTSRGAMSKMVDNARNK
jgi:hypothetical protein